MVVEEEDADHLSSLTYQVTMGKGTLGPRMAGLPALTGRGGASAP